jgi:hypothetical protein
MKPRAAVDATRPRREPRRPIVTIRERPATPEERADLVALLIRMVRR